MTRLEDVDPGAEAVFGGKAVGLSWLMAAGARVPPGFAVQATTEPPERWSEPERRELADRAAGLPGEGRLAVRSSAPGEDATQRSFAGLFETVLNVRDPEAVPAAAAQCIASGAAGRVLQYAASAAALPVGVVVQWQIEARSAGVCFTRDPAGRDGAVLVEAVAGLGDALVSGRAAPQRFRVYPSALGRWEVHPEPGPAPPVIRVDEAASIAREASRLAEARGRPLDLEWAIDGQGQLWWLQGRPITTLVNPPRYDVERGVEGVDDGPVSVWSNLNVRETMPDPLAPLTWTLWRDVIGPLAVEQLCGVSPARPAAAHLMALDRVQGRIYMNMNALLSWPLGRLILRLLRNMDARAGAAFEVLLRQGVLRPRRRPRSTLRLRAGMFLAGLRSVARLASALRPRRCLKVLAADSAGVARRGPLQALGDRPLLDEVRLLAAPECRRLRDGLQMEAVAIVLYQIARRLFRRTPEARDLLAAGVVGPTARISVAVDDLVAEGLPLASTLLEPLGPPELRARLDATPAGLAWQGKLDRFLEEFGHRGPREFDLGAPRWVDEPGKVLELVRAGLRAEPGERLGGRLERLAGRRRSAVAAAVASAPWWRRPLLRSFARLVELYMPLREAPKHYGMVVFQRMRGAALELGRRLTERGSLAAPDEVFLLEWPELGRLARGEAPPGDLRATLDRRRERLRGYEALRAPELLRSDGVPVPDPAPRDGAPDDGRLRGTAVSPGRATGPVCVLTEPDPSAMADGDVIVMDFADPGWTPLFPRASAVVMEVGGLMCHAAVVARELGVPAVFGVAGATRKLSAGQRVAVDGSAGTVEIQPKSSAEAPPCPD